MTSPLRLATAVLTLATACSESIPSDPLGPAHSALAATKKADAAPITLRWHQVARDFVVDRRPNPPTAARSYALLSVAEYRAATAARHEDVEDGAIAGASAAIMTYLYPDAAATFDALVREQAPTWPPGDVKQYARGEQLGRAIGAAVADRARVDGFDATWTGSIPTGAGFWVSTGSPPLKPLLGSMTPFFLRRGDQFRPPAPPAFGSAAFLSALAEIRQISDTRTAEQTRIALFWALQGGTFATQGFWDNEAANLIGVAGLGERDATHILALMHAAAMDAEIACFDAKYTYWFLRPVHADPGITLPIPMPSHPAYPSAHSCLSSASASVLSNFFPREADRLDAMVIEAGLSRMYAGIHYRFDVETGRALGARVARFAIRLDKKRRDDDSERHTWNDDSERR